MTYDELETLALSADGASRERLRALLRRDWAVRVLDAEARVRTYQSWAPYPNADGTFGVFILSESFADEDAARHATAMFVFSGLPYSVQAQLGECP